MKKITLGLTLFCLLMITPQLWAQDHLDVLIDLDVWRGQENGRNDPITVGEVVKTLVAVLGE